AKRDAVFGGVDFGDFVIAHFMGGISGPEALALSIGSPTEARRTMRNIRLRHGLRPPPYTAMMPPLAEIPSPKQCIAERHRPHVVPSLVESVEPERVSPDASLVWNEIIAQVSAGKHPCHIVDWLKSVTPMEWAECVALVSLIPGVAENLPEI